MTGVRTVKNDLYTQPTCRPAQLKAWHRAHDRTVWN